MIGLGLRVDKSKKIKSCCADMKEEDFCFLISKDKVYAYDYEYGHLDFPEPIRYCPWCGAKIELKSKDEV